GVDEHALDLGLLGGGLDERDVLRRPGFRIETFPVVGHEIDGRGGVTLFLGQHAVRHRHEPDVYVQAGLMTGVVAWRRPAARLRQVADKDTIPAGRLRGSWGEFLQKVDQAGMAPIAVARQAHHLPGPAVDGKFNAGRKTSAVIVADRYGFPDRRQLDRAEELFRRQSFFFFLFGYRRLRRGER